MIEAKMHQGHLVMKCVCEDGAGQAERHVSIPIGELSKRVVIDEEAETVTQLLREAAQALPSGPLKGSIMSLLGRLDRPVVDAAQVQRSIAHWVARMEQEAATEAALQNTLRNCEALRDCWCDTETTNQEHNHGI